MIGYSSSLFVIAGKNPLFLRCVVSPTLLAEMEDRFGYDLKHAMHCIRLQRTCIEILEGKGVLVKRPDAEELVSIRNGAWSYDRWMQEVRKLEDQANELVKVTKLPKTSNYKRANFICQAVVEKMWEI